MVSVSDKNLPPEVALRLQQMMFAAPGSTASYIVGLVVITASLGWRVGDATMTCISAGALGLNLIRVITVAVYRPNKPDAYLNILLVLGIAYSLLMSALTIRAYQIGNPEGIALAMVAAIGYLAGVLIRASAVPRLAIPHLTTLFVPVFAAALIAEDGRYWPEAFLLVCFYIGCRDLSRTVYSHVSGEIMSRHQLSIASKIENLTRLANRPAFEEALAIRLAGGGSAIVAMIDLDGFKAVNDTHGHPVGDGLLKAVASRLVNAAGGGQHLVVRYGGDEFAVLFDAGTCDTEASRIGADIVRTVSLPFDIDGRRCVIGATVGLATSRDDEGEDALTKRADDALYGAKQSGKGRVAWSRVAPPMVPDDNLEITDGRRETAWQTQ